jgi:hypothetical protein
MAAAMLTVLYVRWLSPWLPLGVVPDAILWTGLGFGLLGLWKIGAGGADTAGLLLRWSLLCPLGLLPWLQFLDARPVASSLVASGILYVAVAYETGSRRLTYLAGLVLNAGLLLLFSDLGLKPLSFYALPVGATLLLMVQVEHDRLSRQARFSLQNLGIGIICASAAYETFATGGLLSFAVLLGLCLGSILLGLGLRIRAFVFCSTGILVGTVIGQVARASIEMALPMWTLLTSLGMLLLGGMIVFSWKRQQLEAWYRLAVEDFSRWD